MKLVVSCRFVTDVRDHDVKKADDGTVADPGGGSGGSVSERQRKGDQLDQ